MRGGSLKGRRMEGKGRATRREWKRYPLPFPFSPFLCLPRRLIKMHRVCPCYFSFKMTIPHSLNMLRLVSYLVPYKAPANPTATATSSTSIFLKWDAVDLPNIRGILRGYTVYYEEAWSSVHPSVLRNVTVDISVIEVQLTNLHKYTEYHIWVTAFTTRQGLKSISLFVRTLEDSKMYLFLFSKSSSEVGFMVYFGVFLLCFIKAVAPPFSGFVPALTDLRLFTWCLPACPLFGRIF